MVSFILRVVIIMIGLLLVPIALLTAKDGKFRKLFYVFDNDEDGYDGDRYGFYSNHLGRKPNWLDCYVWCALRNPAYNCRHWKWTSCGTRTIKEIEHEGNTLHKDYRYSDSKERSTIWYKFSCVDREGKKRSSYFLMMPLTSSRSLYFHIGWKFYPHLYLDPSWIEKISKEGFPKYKDRAVPIFSLKIVKK